MYYFFLYTFRLLNFIVYAFTRSFPSGSDSKESACIWETWVWSLGWEDSLEEGMATHSSILGLPLWLSWLGICLQFGRPGFDPWVGKIPWRREQLPTPVFWPGEFHGLVHGVAKSWTWLNDFHFHFLLLQSTCCRAHRLNSCGAQA